MKKTKRERWEVRPSNARERKKNYGVTWTVTRNKIAIEFFYQKKKAVRRAAFSCRTNWRLANELSELVIKGVDGVIKDTRTYGKDPCKVPG